MEAFSYDQLEARDVVRKAQPALDEARARGYEDGYGAGMAEAHAQLVPASQALAAALAAAEQAAQELADASERRAVELALVIADKVLPTSLELRPELIVDLVGGALRRVSTPQQVTLEVNPADLDLVRGSVERLVDGPTALERLDVVGERRIPRGSCVLQATEGEIDGQISEQLARAAEVLRDNLSTDRAPEHD